MLGGTIPDEDDNDVIAEQLAKISEQMAIKNRRSKKIWKIAGVIFLVIVLLNILLIIFNMSVSKNVSTDSSTTFIEIGEDDVIDVEIISNIQSQFDNFISIHTKQLVLGLTAF